MNDIRPVTVTHIGEFARLLRQGYSRDLTTLLTWLPKEKRSLPVSSTRLRLGDYRTNPALVRLPPQLLIEWMEKPQRK